MNDQTRTGESAAVLDRLSSSDSVEVFRAFLSVGEAYIKARDVYNQYVIEGHRVQQGDAYRRYLDARDDLVVAAAEFTRLCRKETWVLVPGDSWRLRSDFDVTPRTGGSA